MDDEDVGAWRDLVSAEQKVVRLRAALGSAGSRGEILDQALAPASSAWDQLAALNYLKAFRGDIVSHVPELFHLALGGRWEGLAREVLATGSREDVMPAVVRSTQSYLPAPSPEDYLRVASLLSILEAKEALSLVVGEALASEDSEIVEAGRFIRQRYAPVCSSATGNNSIDQAG